MRTIIHIAVVVAALGTMVWTQGKIDQGQKDYGTNRMATEDVPAALAVTTFALGPLRTLVADALWWRAIRQQDKGEYYDALQLANWITQLQPTYASVWSYQGWNMSYNIVADFNRPEEKWEWIRQAIHMLRDRGLHYNPDNPAIRHQLAMIFHDKIGGTNDYDAQFYQRQWTFMMMDYFNGWGREELIKLAAAPKNRFELLQDKAVTSYVDDAIRHGINPLDFARLPPKLPQPDHPQAAGMRNLYYFYKRERIENELKMDCDRVLEIDREYGPLDWWTHQAQTIYWLADDNFENFKSGTVNYAPLLRQAMMQSFLDGDVVYLAESNSIVRTHNLKILGRIHTVMDYMMVNSYSRQVDSEHKKFLELAVTILHTYNRLEDAKEAFEHYKIDYLRDEKDLTFEEFVKRSIRNTVKEVGPKEARALVESMIFNSMMWLNFGEYDLSNGTINRAKETWMQHQAMYGHNIAKQLPPFETMLKAVRQRFVTENKLDEAELRQREETARKQKAERVDTGGVKGSVRPPDAE